MQEQNARSREALVSPIGTPKKRKERDGRNDVVLLRTVNTPAHSERHGCYCRIFLVPRISPSCGRGQDFNVVTQSARMFIIRAFLPACGILAAHDAPRLFVTRNISFCIIKKRLFFTLWCKNCFFNRRFSTSFVMYIMKHFHNQN